MSEETARQRYIRLLKQLADAKGPMFTNNDDSVEDKMGFHELLEDGYIVGSPLLGNIGELLEVCGMRITVRGRLFLEELQKAEWQQ